MQEPARLLSAPSLVIRARGARVTRQFGRASLYVLVLALCVLFGFPLFWTLSSSLKKISEMYIFPPPLLPKVPQWANYHRLLTEVPFAMWFLNTVGVVVLATFGTLLSSTLVGYSFARFKYRGRDLLFVVTLSTMMLPAQVTLIPRFIIFHKLGWINTIKPLWVPAWFGGGAFYIFLMRQFIMSLPRELDEAAIIDGASRFAVLWRILMPICKPALITVTVISFMQYWSQFIEPLIYLNSPKKFTLVLGLQYFSTFSDEVMTEPLYHIFLAGCVLTILPAVALFLSAQKLIMPSVAMTGIKG